MSSHEQTPEDRGQTDQAGQEAGMEPEDGTTRGDDDVNSPFPEGEVDCADGHWVEGDGNLYETHARFTPTHEELILLVRYWYKRVLEDDWFSMCYGYRMEVGRSRTHACTRINQAEALVGEEAVKKAEEEVRNEFKAGIEDDRLWDIFENGTVEEWQAVQNETWRMISEDDATKALKRLEELETSYRGDFIALVLTAYRRNTDRVVLGCPSNSAINALIQATDNLEIETDKSKMRTLMVEQHFSEMGYLRVIRYNGDLLFEFHDASRGPVRREVLESVAEEIKKQFHAETGKQSENI